MAYWDMQAPLQKEAPEPTGYVETDYPRIKPSLNPNIIPHHAAVETAEDGERAGRHSYPRSGSPI